MKVSAITPISNECNPRRNLFIRFANSFMSSPEIENPVDKAGATKPQKMGIEQLEEFTIYPKQVVDGKTIITA